jgi:hypothetical protein
MHVALHLPNWQRHHGVLFILLRQSHLIQGQPGDGGVGDHVRLHVRDGSVPTGITGHGMAINGGLSICEASCEVVVAS